MSWMAINKTFSKPATYFLASSRWLASHPAPHYLELSACARGCPRPCIAQPIAPWRKKWVFENITKVSKYILSREDSQNWQLWSPFSLLAAALSPTWATFKYKAELQKRADRADQSVLFFLAGANFWEKHAKNCAIMSRLSCNQAA